MKSSELVAAERGAGDLVPATDSRLWVCQHSKPQQRWVKKGNCFKRTQALPGLKRAGDNFCHGLAMFSSGMLLAGTHAVAQTTEGSEAFAQGSALGEKSFNFPK